MDKELRDRLTSTLTELGENKKVPNWLIEEVYGELHRIAGAYLGRERKGHTLQPSALVNEAYLKLVDQKRVDWQGKTHFLAVGAQAMRRILLDHARGKGRVKRGGDLFQVTLVDTASRVLGRHLGLEDLITLDDALGELEARDPRQVKVLEMKFFAGLKTAEIAEVLSVSTRTVEMEWTHARAWLRRVLAERAG